VDVVIGSLLPPGTVAVLYYADRINQLPLGIIGTAVGTALLPTLSREVRSGQPAAAIGTLNRAIEYALLLTLPATFALAVAAHPIIVGLFEHGKFGADDGWLTTQALIAYASGLPAFVLMKVLVPAFFARGDTSLPVKTGIAAVALNLALNVAFMTPLRHLGPPLASSIASWANVAALAFMLRRRGHMMVDAKLRRCVTRMVAACLAMIVAVLLLERFALPALDAIPLHGMRVVGLVVLVSAGIVTYAGAAHVFGAFDVREVAGSLLRRRRRKAATPAV
jgi:putative peptidoglycan lipid II flippase